MKRLKRLIDTLTLGETIELITILSLMIVSVIVLSNILFNFLFVGEVEVHETPVGIYECQGGVFKVCTGSEEVKHYVQNS